MISMRICTTLVASACFLAASLWLSFPSIASAETTALPNRCVGKDDALGSYLVLISEKTWNDPDWRDVAVTLQHKHDGVVFRYSRFPDDVEQALRETRPRYACLVARPEEAGRGLFVTMHRLARRLDDDPYGDVLWGVVTGYDAGDALETARLTRPLVVERALSGAQAISLAPFRAALKFSESRKGVMWEKTPDGATEQKECPQDTTKAIVDALNEFEPDAFYTSGHATENDWQIGYSYKNGQLRCKDGRVYGIDLDGKKYPVDSPNPKIFMPLGNCLIGHIDERDCMATAMMHSAGVRQMIGYLGVTFFGYAGWGTGSFFDREPGRLTLSEAFFFNNDALVHELRTRFPEKADVDFESYDQRAVGLMVRKHELLNKERNGVDRDLLGLLWDRDIVAFYGDPAWEVRLPNGDPAWDYSWSKDGDKYIFRIATTRDGSWGDRPVVAWLPQRVLDPKVVEGSDLNPVVTDDFILLPLQGSFEKGERHTVTFTAQVAPQMSPDDQRRALKKIAEPLTAEDKDLIANMPEQYRERLREALTRAGDNKKELTDALRRAPEDQKESVSFLVANMPDRDLTGLSADFILNDVKLAHEARERTDWARKIPEDLFLNYVLPYANLNERRDDWRADFFDRFMPIATECQTPGAVAQRLNREVFKTLDVQYHATKRPKPDQSPYESTEAGYASCTGLSILLIDACRAVGVPARAVGTPLWSDRSGNHTWVEIWDDGWRYLGAAEPSAFNQTWFTGKAAKASKENRMHRIYAASFKKTDLSFPLVWDRSIDYVSARDVTDYYANPCKVRFKTLEKSGGAPMRANVVVRNDDETVARYQTTAVSNDDRTPVRLAGGVEYEVRVTPAQDADASFSTTVKTSDEGEQEIVIAPPE